MEHLPYMKRKFNITFLYTSAVSSLVYLICYLLIANQRNDLYEGVSFFIGLGVYLVIRLSYKSNSDLDPILAKAYRLIVCLVPVLLLATNMVSLYNTPIENPSFIEFLSVEDLKWSGPFVIAFWPILNFASLLINIGVVLIILCNTIAIYGFIIFAIILALILIMLIKKLMRLKKQSVLNFSLPLAFAKVVLPLIAFMLVVYYER